MRRLHLHPVAWVVLGVVLLGSLAIAVCGLRDDLATADDRVALTGLHPLRLPHHRTCGFPHPAIADRAVLTGQ